MGAAVTVTVTVAVDVGVVVVVVVVIVVVVIRVDRGWYRRGARGRRIGPGWGASTAPSRGGGVCVCRSSGCRHGG